MNNPELLSAIDKANYERLLEKVPQNCVSCVFAGKVVLRQVRSVKSGVPIWLAETRVEQLKNDCAEGLVLTLPAVGMGPLEAQCSNVQSELSDLPNS